VGVGIGKFLINLGFRNFFNTKITQSGSMLAPGWLSVLLHYSNGLNVVMDC
jgi:hypothetical protein